MSASTWVRLVLERCPGGPAPLSQGGQGASPMPATSCLVHTPHLAKRGQGDGLGA